MELNILNKKLNVDSNSFHDKTELEFWNVYFQLLNLREPVLTDKDCNIMANIMSEPINEGVISLKRVEELTKTTATNLYTKFKQLSDKGFLVKTDEGFILNPSLIRFQKYIKATTNKQIKFTIPINICQ